MFDLSIDQSGELILNNNDIAKTESDNLRFQRAVCVIQSVTNNWFSDKSFGANVEEIVGEPCIDSTCKDGKSKMTESLISNDIYAEEEIHIEYSIKKNVIEYVIYLRNSDMLTSKVLFVSIDLVKGINVRIGVD